MKRIIIMLVVSLVFTIPVTAQIGKLKNLKDKVPSTKKISDIKRKYRQLNNWRKLNLKELLRWNQ